MRLLNIHCTGYEYFKDSLALCLGISCFDCSLMKQEEEEEDGEIRDNHSAENYENVSVKL